MANPDHLARLKKHIENETLEEWNQWRRDTEGLPPEELVFDNGRSLRAVDLSGAHLESADLCGADLSNANLTQAHLAMAKLHKTDLCGANLRMADLTEADIGEAGLGMVDLSEARLRGANLQEADLTEASLGLADLTEADLRGANLRGADMTEADIRMSSLRGANLRGANLFGANLLGARLNPSQLSEEQSAMSRNERVHRQSPGISDIAEELAFKKAELRRLQMVSVPKDEVEKREEKIASLNAQLEAMGEMRQRKAVEIERATDYLQKPNMYIEGEVKLQERLFWVYLSLAAACLFTIGRGLWQLEFCNMVQHLCPDGYMLWGRWIVFAAPKLASGVLLGVFLTLANNRRRVITNLHERKRGVDMLRGIMQGSNELAETPDLSAEKTLSMLDQLAGPAIHSALAPPQRPTDAEEKSDKVDIPNLMGPAGALPGKFI